MRDLNQDRLPYDCMDAGGRVTQEQLLKDAVVEQAGQELLYNSLHAPPSIWRPDGKILRVLI